MIEASPVRYLGTADSFALPACPVHPCFHALAYELKLEFSERCQEVQQKSAQRSGSVELLSVAFEADSDYLPCSKRVVHVFYASEGPI